MAGVMSDIHTLQARVRAALEEERTLLDVERELVDRADLDSDRRDALWLYAWSYRDRIGRRGPRRMRRGSGSQRR